MLEHDEKNPAAGLAAVSGMWMSAWLQPWSALYVWNDYWRDQWKSWLVGRAAAPAAWLPALAEERFDQPEAINFFLPWLPRVDALVVPFGAPGEDDAMRLMLRAALPRVGAFGPSEWLTVDATIRHSAGSEPPHLPEQAVPVVIDAPAASAKRPRATLRRVAEEAKGARADAPAKQAEVQAAPQGEAPAAKAAAPKPASSAKPARSAARKAAPRKPSAAKDKTSG